MKKSYFAHVFNLKAEFPKFRIQKKEDSNLMKFISWVLFLITFGQMKRETFMDLFVTTLGYTVYVNSSWDRLPEDDKLSVLVHEATHIRQYDEEGVLFALKYALFPLPVLLPTLGSIMKLRHSRRRLFTIIFIVKCFFLVPSLKTPSSFYPVHHIFGQPEIREWLEENFVR